MLCQLELLTQASATGDGRGRAQAPTQTFPSLCGVCTRHAGQNFRNASFSVVFFLFRDAV